jgi:quercetin dioxygenase-like cupin family protein
VTANIRNVLEARGLETLFRRVNLEIVQIKYLLHASARAPPKRATQPSNRQLTDAFTRTFTFRKEFEMNKPTYPMIALTALALVLGTVIATQNAPSARWVAAYDNLTMPKDFKAMMVVVDFPAGSVFPLHSHGGPVVAMVIEGEITLVQNGVSKVYKAGQSWTESVGQIHEARNAGSAKAAVAVTYLLPKGAAPDIFVGK